MTIIRPLLEVSYTFVLFSISFVFISFTHRFVALSLVKVLHVYFLKHVCIFMNRMVNYAFMSSSFHGFPIEKRHQYILGLGLFTIITQHARGTGTCLLLNLISKTYAKVVIFYFFNVDLPYFFLQINNPSFCCSVNLYSIFRWFLSQTGYFNPFG